MPDYGTTLKNTLDNLEQILLGRSKVHGDYEETFKLIAEYWTLYLRGIGLIGYEDELGPNDSAHMLTLFKIARASVNPDNEENSDDAAGYQVLASAMIRGAKRQTVDRDAKIEWLVADEKRHKRLYNDWLENLDDADDGCVYDLLGAGDDLFEAICRRVKDNEWSTSTHKDKCCILFKNYELGSGWTGGYSNNGMLQPAKSHERFCKNDEQMKLAYDSLVEGFKKDIQNENVV